MPKQLHQAIVAVLLLGILAAGAVLRADEPKPALVPKLPKTMPPRVDLKEPVSGLVQQFLGEDAAARAKAEADLLKKGPLLAVAVQTVWLKQAKDDASRQRLQRLAERALGDSAENALVIFRHAQALHSVADGVGPFKSTDLKVVDLRHQAKVFHFFFVDPKVYARQVQDKTFGDTESYTPSVDLPAALALYRMAGEMFGRLARAEKDPDRVKHFIAEQARCARVVKELELLRPF